MAAINCVGLPGWAESKSSSNAEAAPSQTLLQDVLVAPATISPASKFEEATVSYDKKAHRFAIIPVFYATTRLPQKGKILSYSKKRGTGLDCGVCDVDHACDDSEQRSADYLTNLGWKISDKGDHGLVSAPKHFQSTDAMFAAIKQVQAKSAEKRLIVFVHGYAASFNKAARMGSRLAYGTGIPVLIFSWPTQHNFLVYTADECNAEWTYPRFEKFLRSIDANFPADNVSLISHSMGARIVSWALQSQGDRTADNSNRGRYQHVFFCCPDIDKDTFATYADRIRQASKDTVVFVSGNDIRLGFSELLHGHARLGEFNSHQKGMVSIPGVETVDFTAIDSAIGHAMPYPLIFKALNHDQLPAGVQLVEKKDVDSAMAVVKIAGKR